MKSKEELIKQVVILAIALVVVIVMAICLNMGKVKKDDKEITVKNSQNTTTVEKNKNEMMNNLKGLLETPTQNEFEDSGTIKQPIETGVKQELRTNSNEVIQYQEIWNGDN